MYVIQGFCFLVSSVSGESYEAVNAQLALHIPVIENSPQKEKLKQKLKKIVNLAENLLDAYDNRTIGKNINRIH